MGKGEHYRSEQNDAMHSLYKQYTRIRIEHGFIKQPFGLCLWIKFGPGYHTDWSNVGRIVAILPNKTIKMQPYKCAHTHKYDAHFEGMNSFQYSNHPFFRLNYLPASPEVLFNF